MNGESEKTPPDISLSLFSAVMGIAGLGLAWRKAGPVLGVAPWIGEVLIFTSVLVFAWIAIAYGIKIALAPQAMRSEIKDLVRFSFAATVPLCLQLLAAAVLPLDHALAMLMWCAAVAMQFVLVLIILRRWTQGANARAHLKPSILLPTAGLLLGPATGVTLGFIELSWMMFAVGVFLWLLFMALLLERMFFEMPLTEDELPLVAILVSPPALAFTSYIALNQFLIDGFARGLFYAVVFLVIFVMLRAGQFARSKFTLAWWSFTFPAAAAAGAMLDYRAAGSEFPLVLCALMLALASFVVALCAVRTLLALR